MRRRTLGLLVVGFAVLSAGQQELRGQTEDDLWRQYDREDKSELGAAGLEVLIPIVGHAYAGDAERGLKPLAVSVGGLVLAIVGTSVGCSDRFQGTCINEGSTGLVALGLIAYLGGRIWGVVSALETARDHNTVLKQRLGLTFRPGPQGYEIGFSVAVP